MASTSARSDTAAFRRLLAGWYRECGRHELPWRQTRDPYAVLISEVMLQQTQVERVVPYYHEWLGRWPTFAALAQASPADVIRAWRGLGYNRRALYLHRLAAVVLDSHEGSLPTDPATMRTLPGIGPYTEAAVRSFAREEPVAVVDTNIGRVIARAFLGLAGQRDAGATDVAAHSRALLPSRGVRCHNLALMDLGALICTARRPACEACPVSRLCAFRAAGFPEGVQRGASTPKFETTARFARGRIVDRLREGPASHAELARTLPAHHLRRLDSHLASLERDGLATRSGENWALPGQSG